MHIRFQFICFLFLGLISCNSSYAQDLGNGFYDHGVACPQSNHRGVVATTGAGGKNVVLAWLFDHRGGYGLLSVDADSGASRLFPTPFPPGDAPYSSLLSSTNKFYGYFNYHFVEFDPVLNKYTFSQRGFDLTAMAFTEDDNGLIWAATYPKCGLVSYNPKTKELVDHGFINKEAWTQYPRSIVSDVNGWIYVALGNTESQIIAYNPKTKEIKKILSGDQRKRGIAFLYRSLDGMVYGTALQNAGKSIKLLNGVADFTNDGFTVVNEKKYITGSQVLFHKKFPDGSVIEKMDFVSRQLVVKGSTGVKRLAFTYPSEGAWVMGINVTSTGKIVGGASFPMRIFEFDPATGQLKNYPAYGQFNASARFKNYVYFGSYPQGALVRYNANNKISTDKENPNPVVLGNDIINIHRPHRVLVLEKQGKVLLTGTPEYGYTGGGMLIWNMNGKGIQYLSDSSLIPDQSVMSMVAVDNDMVLAGTTTAPGTGGLKKARQGTLCLFDAKEMKVVWKENILEGIQTYNDLHRSGKHVFGVADSRTFFVFDLESRKVIYKERIPDEFGQVVTAQSPRVFVKGPSANDLYMLCTKGILKVNKLSFQLEKLALSPVKLEAGGAYYDNKIYFVSGSHLCSYRLN